MPPKKAIQAKVKKTVEDKTFGLKNKNKSKKVQAYINTVESNASMIGKSHKEAKKEEAARAAKLVERKAAELAKKESAELFKTVVKETKVPFGVDPKFVVCEFFKAGNCTKGAKCKFSHDLGVAMKSSRIDVYSDPRDLDTMDKWDTEKLNQVVDSKAGGRMPPTEIVCKYFLDAIESGRYGWLWECPNGAVCHYRHALPPGFILKPKLKPGEVKEEEDDEGPTIEEKLEEERAKLVISKCTPLTFDLFQKWKAEKAAKKELEVEKKRVDASKKSGGTGLHIMSGRDLFRYDPSLFVDDDAAENEYEIEETNSPIPEPLYERDEDYEDNVDEQDEEDEKKESNSDSKSASAANSVAAVASAIDANLFLDDDENLPDDDD